MVLFPRPAHRIEWRGECLFMFYGIDVSSHQGTIDWEEVKAAGIHFVVLRAGYGNDIFQMDSCFEANVKGAAAAGLKIGVYWFSYAVSVEDAEKEAAVCRQVIEPYRENISYPVAYDYENESWQYSLSQGISPTSSLVNSMANAFLGAMKADGWETALYTNNDYCRNIFSAETLSAWDIWLADYSAIPSMPCEIQQTNSAGMISGVAGNVGTDTSYKDYLSITE